MLEKQNTADQEKTATGDACAMDDIVDAGVTELTAPAFTPSPDCYPGVDRANPEGDADPDADQTSERAEVQKSSR